MKKQELVVDVVVVVVDYNGCSWVCLCLVGLVVFAQDVAVFRKTVGALGTDSQVELIANIGIWQKPIVY